MPCGQLVLRGFDAVAIEDHGNMPVGVVLQARNNFTRDSRATAVRLACWSVKSGHWKIMLWPSTMSTCGFMARGRLCNLSGPGVLPQPTECFFPQTCCRKKWREGLSPAGIEPFEKPSLNDLDEVSQDKVDASERPAFKREIWRRVERGHWMTVGLNSFLRGSAGRREHPLSRSSRCRSARGSVPQQRLVTVNQPACMLVNRCAQVSKRTAVDGYGCLRLRRLAILARFAQVRSPSELIVSGVPL